MSRHRFCLTLLALTVITVSARSAEADPLVASWGGGLAAVTNDEGLLPTGTVTAFGLNATIDDDGTAQGHFTCMILGGDGGLSADLTGGADLGSGCVVLTGTSTCIFPGIGVFFDEPITLYVCAGGPGAGHFVLCFDNFEAEFGCDEEIVTRGQLKYQPVLVP